MKPAPFRYLRPAGLAEALAALSEHGDAALVLAGGQSLMPMLNMRVVRPDYLVDINRIAALSGLSLQDGWLRIGALTRYAEIMRSDLVRQHAPLLGLALPYVAHAAIRNRGTLGGSLALADPAAEMPACALALRAEIELASQRGQRRVAASDYFHGLYETARQADELLVAVHYPLAAADTHCGFYEVSRRHGDFALAGVALAWQGAAAGIADCRIAAFGLLDRPVLAPQAASRLCAEGDCNSAVLAAFADDLRAVGHIQDDVALRIGWAQTALRRAFAGSRGETGAVGHG